MTNITFLTLQDILFIHSFLVERYGGEHGVRDSSLLSSALHMPSAGIGGEYFHADIFEMAAAYLFHLAMNHPFVDGNKRTAAIAAMSFLEMNGYRVDIRESGLADMTLAVIAGKVDKPLLADVFRENATRRF